MLYLGIKNREVHVHNLSIISSEKHVSLITQLYDLFVGHGLNVRFSIISSQPLVFDPSKSLEEKRCDLVVQRDYAVEHKFLKPLRHASSQGFQTIFFKPSEIQLRQIVAELVSFAQHRSFYDLLPPNLNVGLQSNSHFLFSHTKKVGSPLWAKSLYLMGRHRAVQLYQFDNRHQNSFGRLSLLKKNVYDCVREIFKNQEMGEICLGHISDRTGRLFQDKCDMGGQPKNYSLFILDSKSEQA